MRIVSREEAAALCAEYAEIMADSEEHYHMIVEDDNGVMRWAVDETVRKLIDDQINLNDLVVLFHCIGIDKSSKHYREMYRKMGYSLSGYWE